MKTEVEIKKLGINGEGIGYINRKILFVKGALLGEKVEVEITKQTRNFLEGKMVRVITASKDRVAPRCREEKECLGCSLLHMNYDSQLVYKKESIRESIAKYTKYDVSKTVFKDVIGCVQSEGFITSINVPIVEYKGSVTFGIYQRESKYLTILTRCFKQDARITQCLFDLQKILTDNHCKSYNDKVKKGLRFLKLKLVENTIQLVFITGKDGVSQEVVDKISQLALVESIFVSVNTSRYQEFDEVGYSKLFGKTRVEFHCEDIKYLLSVKSKLPENLEMYGKKNQVLLELLEDSQKILSLHCGLGIVELISNKEVMAIDEKNYHIEDAKLNKKGQRNEKVTFQRGDIDDKVVIHAKKREYDTFLIQNERFGLSEAIKNSILLSKVKHVIYACEAHSTLAKDLGDLEKYYTLEKIVALDTFVYTPYVTTIVKLKRK